MPTQQNRVRALITTLSCWNAEKALDVLKQGRSVRAWSSTLCDYIFIVPDEAGKTITQSIYRESIVYTKAEIIDLLERGIDPEVRAHLAKKLA